MFGTDTIDGKERFQEGSIVIGGLNMQVELGKVNIAARLQQKFQGKNEESRTEESPAAEPENSNGPEFSGLVDILYAYSPNFNFRLLGDLRHYSESDRRDELSDLPYRGTRTRMSLGFGVVYQIDERLSLSSLAKYFRMPKDKDINLGQDTDFQGGNLSLGLTYRF